MNFFQAVKNLVQDPANFEALERYVGLIEKFAQKFNLTAWSPTKIWEQGVYQSLVTFWDWAQGMENQPVLDIGAGAGFPSLPLKIVFPKIRLTIYEANAKKVAFLNNVKGELNLDFKVVHTRAETSQDRESFAFILARAVADLKHLIQMSYHLGQPNCQFLFVKGAGYQQEINASQALVKKLKIKIQVYRAPEPALSYLITFRKALPTPVDFPPPWAKMHQA